MKDTSSRRWTGQIFFTLFVNSSYWDFTLLRSTYTSPFAFFFFFVFFFKLLKLLYMIYRSRDVGRDRWGMWIHGNKILRSLQYYCLILLLSFVLVSNVWYIQIVIWNSNFMNLLCIFWSKQKKYIIHNVSQMHHILLIIDKRTLVKLTS